MPEALGIFLVESLVDVAGSTVFTDAAVAFAEGSFLGISGASLIGSAAILGATIGLSYALRPDIPTPESGSQALKQAVPPRIRGYGTNRLAGFYMLFEAGGSAPATSYDVIAFHSGQIGSVAGFYLSDDIVHADSDISHGGSGHFLAEYADGRYGENRVDIEVKLGAASQTSSALLTSDPNINAVWTSAFNGHGIAYAVLTCGGFPEPADFTRVYPRGHPELSLLCECSPVWDPRDPAQSRNDESTWVVSHNPVIQLIDYLTRVDGGMGLDLDLILPPTRLAEWIVEADVCDASVATATGVEKRYQCDGWFEFNNKPEDVINNMLSSCDGWLAEAGDGTLSLTVGLYRAPADPAITEKHIIGFALNYGQADEDLVNQLDITFTDPTQKYVSVQTDPWRDEESISLTGIVRPQSLSLPWVQSNSQARRLADRAMQRLTPALTGSFTTTLYGLRYLGKRWVPLQYPFVSGLQDCVVEIQGAEIDLMAGRIVWNFIRIGADIEAYNPATDEGSIPVVPPPVAVGVGLDFRFAFDSQYIALLEDI